MGSISGSNAPLICALHQLTGLAQRTGMVAPDSKPVITITSSGVQIVPLALVGANNRTGSGTISSDIAEAAGSEEAACSWLAYSKPRKTPPTT